jgi:BASS family bile acid:Na+ symporter
MEGNVLTTYFLPAALFIIMLGMGLSLVVEDFKRVVVFPKAVVIGLINQLFILPYTALGLAILWDLPGELAVGLMILAVCPGGVTSNLISHVSKGDTALSVTLTAISSVATIFSIPFIINYALETFMSSGQIIQLDVPKTILQIIVITIIPITIGMMVRRYAEAFAKSMDKPVRIVSTVFLALIIVAAVLKEKEVLFANFKLIGSVTFALNVITMGIGFITAKLLALGIKQRITISIESGIQNGTLAIAIAITILNNGQMAIPGALYSLIMFVTGGFMMYYFGRRTIAKDV